MVAAAHAAGTDLVVDESFVDLPLDGTRAAARRSPSSTGTPGWSRIGGMSKPYWGGLRIGWVRASAPQVQRLAAARVGVDMASPVLDQLVAVHLLADAERSSPPGGSSSTAQRDALVARAGATGCRTGGSPCPRGGVTLWAELDGPISSALARAAEEVGVRLAPGPRFGLDGTLERFLRLPFTLPAADLVEAVGRIAAVRYDLDRAGRPQLAGAGGHRLTRAVSGRPPRAGRRPRRSRPVGRTGGSRGPRVGRPTAGRRTGRDRCVGQPGTTTARWPVAAGAPRPARVAASVVLAGQRRRSPRRPSRRCR